MNDYKLYQERRNKLLDIVIDGFAVIPSNDLHTRTNDTEHPFRQNSNFYYFTGFLETNSILILSNKNGIRKSVLFLSEKNPQMELWTGKRLGPKGAVNSLMVDEAYPIEDFSNLIKGIIEGSKNLYISCFNQSHVTSTVFAAINNLLKSRKKSNFLPTKVHLLEKITEEMRLIKSKHEIEMIKEAVKRTSLGHKVAMAKTKPGMNERDVQAVMEYTFKMNLGDGPAYGMIVAGGDNANVLHYIENNDELKDGDLILIDAGAEYQLYASDVTRTYPVNGKFTLTQSKIYNEVLKAQELVIDNSKPGVTLKELHKIASMSLIKSLLDLEILKGNPQEIYKNGDHLKYYPHGTGHWLGLDVHDQCPYIDENCDEIKLKENMVFTVEPGLYFNSDDKNIPEEFRGIGIRIEDDIQITKNGCVNLTGNIPKTVEEIEKQCKENYISILEKGI